MAANCRPTAAADELVLQPIASINECAPSQIHIALDVFGITQTVELQLTSGNRVAQELRAVYSSRLTIRRSFVILPPDTNTNPRRLARTNTGWRVVAALFVILTLGSGFGFYNLSVYMNALASERGFSIAQLSFAISLFFLLGGIFGIVVARLIERYDVRWVMTIGALVSGSALMLAGLAQTEAQLLWVYALFGAGNAGVSLVPMSTLVTQWFPGANRSMALATASTGLSLGGIVVTPICVALIDKHGVQPALFNFGWVYALLLIPVIWGFIRLPPVQVTTSTNRPVPLSGWSETEARHSMFFWLSTLAYFLLMGAQVGGIAHLFNRAAELVDRDTGSSAVQILAIASISGRLFGGWILSYLSTRLWLLGNALGQGIGMLLIATADSAISCCLGALVFGLTVGNLLMLQPVLLAEAFGLHSYARIFASANAMTTLGVASGPLSLGLVYESGGYSSAYVLAAVLSAVALGVLIVAGPLPDGDNHPERPNATSGD